MLKLYRHGHIFVKKILYYYVSSTVCIPNISIALPIPINILIAMQTLIPIQTLMLTPIPMYIYHAPSYQKYISKKIKNCTIICTCNNYCNYINNDTIGETFDNVILSCKTKNVDLSERIFSETTLLNCNFKDSLLFTPLKH